MKAFKRSLSMMLTAVMLLSTLSINMTVNADETENVIVEEVAAAEKVEEVTDTEFAATEKVEEVTDTETAEIPSTVTERGMQFKIDNLEDVKTIRYAYGEHETEKDIKYGEGAVSHSAKTLRKRGDSCVLQFLNPGLVSIVITYNDGTRDFYKYDVIKSSPTVTRDGGNSITFGNLDNLKVLRYVKGEYETSYDIKRAEGAVAISGKTLTSDTYTVDLDRETYTFCVQYNDESYNYYVTGVCGDNLTWVYDMQSTTLTISGEGEMDDYSYKVPTPWSPYSGITEKLIVNKGVTTLGQDAFDYFEKLVDVSLPSTLKKINSSSFSLCNSLTNIVLPDSVTYLGSFMFKGCKNLESVVIGNGVEIVEACTFEGCSNLKNITLGSNIKYIGIYAFYGCISLDDIDLPDSLEKIDMGAFLDTGYYNNSDNWEDNVLYIDGHMVSTGENDFETCIIKDGTKYIASCAFESSYVDVVYIPESIRIIARDGLSNRATKRTRFMVVKGSYAEQFLVELNETYGYKYSYRYYDPSDIYK